MVLIDSVSMPLQLASCSLRLAEEHARVLLWSKDKLISCIRSPIRITQCAFGGSDRSHSYFGVLWFPAKGVRES
eukprot:scaffold242178_cov16-Prasinocladus_malaysianus.AAC.1